MDTAATPEVVQATGEGQLEGMALASLISSIASFFILPILGSVLGIVFGNIATGRIAADPRLRGKEMARAGIIIGWVGIVLTVLAFLAVILFFVALDDIFN